MTALYSAQDFWYAVTTALQTTDPQEKCRLTDQLYDEILPQVQLTEPADFPEVTPQMELGGVPPKPLLVAPKEVPKRSFATTEGYAATLHAIAHIEFNAINLGLDAAWRFGRDAQLELGEGMAFVCDWLRVAREESKHFSLINNHLHSLGYQYGDFEAHAGLWEMAQPRTIFGSVWRWHHAYWKRAGWMRHRCYRKKSRNVKILRQSAFLM